MNKWTAWVIKRVCGKIDKNLPESKKLILIREGIFLTLNNLDRWIWNKSQTINDIENILNIYSGSNVIWTFETYLIKKRISMLKNI